jgi:subtilisin family serine protease
VTEDTRWYSALAPEAVAEARIIVHAFRDRGIEIGGFPDDAEEDDDVESDGIAFMYAKGHILVREQYLGGAGGAREPKPVDRALSHRGVLDILRENGIGGVEVRRVVRDVVLLRWDHHRGRDTDEGEPPDVPDLLDRIDDELGVGIATPDHVLTAAHTVPCSASEPGPVFAAAVPYPPLCRTGGARVRIFLADTGLVAHAAATFPWLAGVQGDTDQRNADGTIHPYGGHGTFVAGVLRAMAPEAQVHVENIFDTAGSALESDLVIRLDEAFRFGFEILHLTASCMTRKHVPLQALETWLELLRRYKGVICVAPAGNNYTRRPSWPAAFPDVLSVGALATDEQHRADFSNYGGWVDVYAPGEKLINAFGSGTYTYYVPPNEGQPRFTGLTEWSGTSFSAPIVTGLIAARMARCGESAREAAAALLAKARCQAIRGVGPVLLPECDGDCGPCGSEHRGCGCHRGCGYDCRCGCGCGGGHGGHGGVRLAGHGCHRRRSVGPGIGG